MLMDGDEVGTRGHFLRDSWADGANRAGDQAA